MDVRLYYKSTKYMYNQNIIQQAKQLRKKGLTYFEINKN